MPESKIESSPAAGAVTEKRKSISTEYRRGDWEQPFVEAFGEPYREYRRAWDKAGPSWIPDFPLHIDFQLVDACNMRCSFCPRDEEVLQAMGAEDVINRGTKMSLEVFKKVIDEGERHGLRAINLGATAEPLIHRDIVEMVRYARAHGVFDIRMITNGQLLTEKMAARLFEAGLTYLGISVDALTDDTYRRVRRQGLAKVVKNVQAAVALRDQMGLAFPRIRVSFVNAPQSRHEFEGFLAFWRDKVDFVELQDFDDFGGPTVNWTFTCAEPFRRLMVWASGVVGCIAWTAERYPYGHVHGQSIHECWHGSAVAELRRDFTERRPYNAMCLGCYGKMATKE